MFTYFAFASWESESSQLSDTTTAISTSTHCVHNSHVKMKTIC